MTKKQFSPQYRIPPKRILGAAIALVVFFLFLTSVIGLAQKYFAIRAQGKDLVNQQNELKEKEANLSTTNDYLATQAGTEQSLRERFNYIKPGEEMIVITPDTTPAPVEEEGGVAHWWDQLLKGLGLRT